MEGRRRVVKRVDLAGAAHLCLVEGAALLRPEPSVFEAMLSGWVAQQKSRLLTDHTVEARLRMVRRFQEFCDEFPWRWRAQDVEEWTSKLASGEQRRSHSTLRNYQNVLALFMDYLVDGRYGWGAECEERFGDHPVQICHEWNTADHVADYEGGPGRRPFTRQELQDFFDFADERVGAVRGRGRKGWLPAFRDAVLFKVMYAWGLRRREAAMLDVGDFSTNAAAPELGGWGMLGVRYGKASRGGPPRRRNVLTVMPWAAEAVAEYVAEVRPCYGVDAHPALWLTERGGRIALRHVNERFADYREAVGLPAELGPHCLRHSYVTHLIEDGFDPLFVQQQVGHSWGSTTAIYTSVSSDYKNRVLRAALERAWASEGEERP